MAAPAKVGLHPLENQVTTILAWLLARSDEFARPFCRLFMDESAASALDASTRIGVRTWITLPSLPGTGKLFPDLSLEGCDRLFQLLVEVKVDAGPHQFPALGGLWQPEAYIAAWKQETTGAEIRRVGTLTRDGPGYRPSSDPWRGFDASWSDVRQLVASTSFPAAIVAVAEEFVAVLDGTVVKKDIHMSAPLREWGATFLANVAGQLNERIGIVKRGNVVRGKDYLGRYLSFVSPEAIPFRLWFAITEENARYNQPLHEAFAWVSTADNDRLPAGLPTKLEAAGFMWLKDRAGWWRWRRGEQVAALREIGTIEGQANVFAEALAADLVAVGLAAHL